MSRWGNGRAQPCHSDSASSAKAVDTGFSKGIVTAPLRPEVEAAVFGLKGFKRGGFLPCGGMIERHSSGGCGVQADA